MPEVDPYAEFRVSPPPSAAPPAVAAPAADDPYAEFRVKPKGDSGVPTDFKGIIVPVAPPKPVAAPQRDFASAQGAVAPGAPFDPTSMIDTPGALPLTSQDQASSFFPKKIPDYGSVEGKHPIQVGPMTMMVSDEADPSGTTSADIGKSIGSGLTSGLEGLAAVPAGLEKLAGYAAQIPGRIGGMTSEDFAKREAVAHPLVSPEGLASGTKTVGDFLTNDVADYQSKTPVGGYAKSISEAIPGVVAMGPGGLVQKVAMSVGGGTGAEFLANKFKGTPYEGVARFVGSIIGMGGLSKLASKVSPTAKAIFDEHIKGVPGEELVNTVALIKEMADRGIKLSAAQALAKVQGAPGPLSNLQRYVEESRGGGPIMREFYQDQPQQVAAAVEKELGTTAPQTLDPVAAGMRVQEAAKGVIKDVEDRISNASRRYYVQSAPHLVPDKEFADISSNPAFLYSLKRLRNDDILKMKYEGLPANSIEVVDAVTKDMRGQGTAFKNAANPGYQSEKSGMLYSDAKTIRDIARNVARGGSADYNTALNIQALGRKNVLEPMEKGFTGKLSETEGSPAQINKLFAEVPQSGDPALVGKAVKDLVKKDPEAAISIVGQHIRTVFSEATSSKQGVPNQWGGAKFFDQLMRNPEQEKVLEAAVRALPAGNVRWEGFRRLMDGMEAIGMRLHPGSPTEAKRMTTEHLQKGGTIKGLATDVVGGLTVAHVPARLRKAMEFIRLGKNAEGLAKLLTNSSTVGLFGRLIKLEPGSLAENSLIEKLIGIAAPELTKEPGKRPAYQAGQ